MILILPATLHIPGQKKFLDQISNLVPIYITLDHQVLVRYKEIDESSVEIWQEIGEYFVVLGCYLLHFAMFDWTYF
jgi:hypothetical protein